MYNSLAPVHLVKLAAAPNPSPLVFRPQFVVAQFPHEDFTIDRVGEIVEGV
jgi:hypothetical protein